MKLIFIIFLYLELVFCENCSQGLLEELNYNFDLSKKCGGICVIEHPLNPESEWIGLCWNNTHDFVQKLHCNFNTSETFIEATNDSCQVFSFQNKTSNFNTDCLEEFIAAECRKILNGSISIINDFTSEQAFEESVVKKRPRPGWPSTNATATTTTTSFVPPESGGKCMEDELYYNDHCYFLKFFDKIDDDVSEDISSYSANDSNVVVFINSTEVCKTQHPDALGLAVETVEENIFILDFLDYWQNNETGVKRHIILTSGVKTCHTPGIWRGWNKPINIKILKTVNNISETEIGCFNPAYYIINPNKRKWLLSDFRRTFFSEKIHLYMMCKRHYNPKNILPNLQLICLQEYRTSKCYDKKEHKKFCCATDKNDEIWFGCPNDSAEKKYLNHVECTWNCGSDGLFSHEYPICTGKNVCHSTYKKLKYSAPINTFAISNCPDDLWGNSSWYCGENKTFKGRPDFTLCCESIEKREKICKGVDMYLKLWMGCPGYTVVKKTYCPFEGYNVTGLARWHCLENGTFNGTLPDYSGCLKPEIKCLGKDRYGRDWEGMPGETVKKDCPLHFNGFCYWNCSTLGEFETSEPDFSECCPEWVEAVEDMISNNSKYNVVMDAMDNFTRNEDLRLGFSHVLNLTFNCVQLFKRQNSGTQISDFENFLHQYSKVFMNIAGDYNVWSSFSLPNRIEYGNSIIKITQNATFANLGTNASFLPSYNLTLASFKNQGFDFFVTYSSKISGRKFPLENFDDSDWRLEVEKVKSGSYHFAAMGLVMNHSLSSLMFPQKDRTNGMQINSQVLTFTVATIKRNVPTILPDVTVHLSFKHINKTRFPKSEIIRRRLHADETPSGVFNSTICYYYKLSRWSTDGCVVTYSSKEQTNCTCQHLSTIGLLMSIHKYVPNHTLEMVSLISSGITIISLIMALVVFYVFESVKNERVLIGKNLCFCLLLGHVMLICVLDKRFFYIPDNLCTVYAVLLHYVFMAAFAWMFVEGCHLYRMLVLVFDSNTEYRYIYLLIGYGVPLVVVGVTELIGFVFQEQPYGQDELCWLKAPNYIWAFNGPVVFSTSINFLILLIAMKLAISSKMKTDKSSFSNFKLWIKGWFSLSTLLGITWLLGLAYIHNYNDICVYSFVILNGLQGLFIFLFRCVFTEQYKTAFIQKLKCWFPDLEFTESKTSEHVKTGSKIFAISQSGSKFHSETGNNDSGYDTAILNCLNDQIHIQKDILKTLDKLSEASPDASRKSSCGVGIEITVTPAVSEEYLRKNIIINNAGLRPSKNIYKSNVRKRGNNLPELL